MATTTTASRKRKVKKKTKKSTKAKNSPKTKDPKSVVKKGEVRFR